VIDEDLGRSGSGIVRAGFERLLATVCRGVVGAVLSIEASRLARNGRDWHTLLEFCGLVGTLIVDEEGIYDPRLPNDRLLLGMKGTMSEMELSLLRQRSHEAIKLKASRGELFTSIPAGADRVAVCRLRGLSAGGALAGAGVLHRASSAEEPHLRRRLRLWPAHQRNAHRSRPQEDAPWHSPPHARVGGIA
jgi:hypothetical protein